MKSADNQTQDNFDAYYKMLNEKWSVQLYGSGTQVIKFSDANKPWYHIGHLAADVDGDHGRYDVSCELCNWLNGGSDPWWFDLLNRTSPDVVILPNGCEIQATGPMISSGPMGYNITADDSADARIDRGLMINCLLKKERLPW